MRSPLQGIRVLDLSAVLSGPMATAMLADQGAEVIKVEAPGGDLSRRIGPAKGDMSAMFIAANRGKRSITVDFTSPEGQETVRALCRTADVVLENFKVGGLKKYGLDYET
ncbi:MAG: CoA transferase, partial [Tabrizicola sp.]|nr:CoA transferase [Tabrizicola sp.]